MAQTFEDLFLAVAVKNRFLKPEQSQVVLAAYRATAEADRPSIGQLAVELGLLTEGQVGKLEDGVARLMKIRATRVTTRLPLAKPDPAEPIPGYRITGRLGMGGTATVFLAQEKKAPGREVALKILMPQRAMDPAFLNRFRREAELLMQFDHPNIVKGFDTGKVQYAGAPPLHYMALECVKGESVQQRIARLGRLEEGQAVEIILAAAAAVAYLAEQRLIHRDIKPDNLMITPEGTIKLLDLGFAIPMGTEAGGEEEGTTSGTVQYMSPEQAQGMRDLDVRSDIYSLGATLYHMVVGDVPFSGEDSLEVMAKQVLEALSSTSLKSRGISKHMHYFIERMMSKDKDFRYATPAEMIDDIREMRQGFASLQFTPPPAPPAPARPPTVRRRTTTRFTKRRRGR